MPPRCLTGSVSSPWHLVLLFIFFWIAIAKGESFGSRTILREVINRDDSKKVDYALDLNVTNFNDTLKQVSTGYAVLEFFANWCPACRNYKSHYEKVARLFNGPDAVHPGIVLMARVDCAQKVNTQLCNRFSVDHFPTLFWGHPSKFVSGGFKPEDKKNDIRVIDSWRTAELLLEWINKQLGSSHNLDDQKFGNKGFLPAVSTAIHDVEEATGNFFDIIFQMKRISLAARASLINFLQLLVAHHPSKRCRDGSGDLLVDFDYMLQPEAVSDNLENAAASKALLSSFQICGKGIPRGYWIFCRGSKNETRGFSCGLWVLLHSISVRITDRESQFAFATICEFIHDFFACEECRTHFYEMCTSNKNYFNSSREVALWLWSTHNLVNERLMKEEAASDLGDPKFPKMIWPPKQLCLKCRLTHSESEKKFDKKDWNLDEVHKFLTSYYGKSLVLMRSDNDVRRSVEDHVPENLVVLKPTVTVSLRTAFTIALFSCALGAIAGHWRSLQKNRKYSHYLHSSKNI